MDVSTVRIDRNVPLPVGRNFRRTKYPFASMEVGDSFVFPASANESSARSQSNVAGRKSGRKFSVRKTEAGLRCWRIA
jgi:hypothetical protein